MKLTVIPERVTQEILHHGIEVSVSDIPGKPGQDSETKAVQKPIKKMDHGIRFIGENGRMCTSSISVEAEQLLQNI